MKKLLVLALILPFFASATTILPYNPAPGFWDKVSSCKWNIPCYFRQNLGTTITSISGSTNVSAFPTIYNTNNTNLNAGKFELSDWFATTTAPQLVSFGTITTGIWHGTPIEVAYNGTGTTSPTTNHVILGDGTNGFKVVAGFGTSGQTLGSNGAGAAPTWQSITVDQTANYNWTGHHIFSSLFATNASSTNATTTNQYITGITSKLLKTDATGQVLGATANTDYALPAVVLKDYTPATVTMTNTGQNYTIRANYGVGTFTSLGTDSYHIRINTGQGGSAGTTYDQIILGNGTASTTLVDKTQGSGYYTFDCTFDIFLKGATNSWSYATNCVNSNNAISAVGVPIISTSVVDLANGFNIVASSTSSSQGNHTGASDFLRVERIR